MADVISGKLVADSIIEDLKKDVTELKEKRDTIQV